ncbi:beta-ketoacyl-ACP synthase 3 [Microbacterium horticulturae]|uniref:Beta-ketoacyl-ACP synthase 3 n=1 Tax=Microbacterium horticulturae TaxID=3028316 RepID=A0ABY8C1U9_9MICO|nr:beta-ketoacyl-ACP synthase 3 [Microbacterium sp. KACC 23027]WEG10092.1 beta-ketoacyl-ACP synthase 3 [Microbacterium sp. KACC 23027]
MKDLQRRGSRLIGFGHFQPERVLTNDELSTMVETSDEWIRERTGIRERHIAGPDDSVFSMAAAAGRGALDDATVSRVDLVVVASTTATDRSPNTAGRVVAELGLDGAAAIDVSTACSGFEYALGVADQAVRAGSADAALVIGSETLSAITDWTDRSTCVLTADGAGAVVIEASDEPGISPVVWGTVPGLTEAVKVSGDPQRFSQDGRQILRWALKDATGIAQRILEVAGVTLDEIDVFAFHQANLRIIEPLARSLGVTERQIVIHDVEVSGNTSAASVPLGLSKAWHRSELPRGGRALLFGFGGGFAYAGQVVELPR